MNEDKHNGNSNLRGFGKCRLDVEKKILWCEEKPVALPLKAIELLCVLVEKGGEVATKDEIWRGVWQNTFVEETNLTHNIYLLRKTFKDLGEKDLIQTVPRRGYRFAGEVREIQNGELVIEKHSQTRTLIEIQDEKSEPPAAAGGFSRLFTRSAAVIALLFGLIGTAAFFGYQNWQAKTSISQIKSIAVLPFKTIDANNENEQQGLGLADILITRLSHIKEIKVRPTSAVLAYENQVADSASVGKALQVDAVLEGTIHRTTEKIKVTTRLVRIGDNATIWTGQFEKIAAEELKLQDEIALQVVDALALNLSGDEKNAVLKFYTADADAHQLYQKGRYEWNKRSHGAAIEAERLFRNAIEKDPNFMLAYVGLADTMAMNKPRSEETFGVIQKVLERDPNLAEAYATLGFLKMFHKWEWREAETAYKKSIELNPGNAKAHHWYAELLKIEGRYEEAKAEMLRALEINPLSHNFLADLGQIYYFNREYKEAEEYCQKALEIAPDFSFAHTYLFFIYLKTGEYDRAGEAYISIYKTDSTLANQSDERLREIEANLDKLRKIYREGGIKKFVESLAEETQDGNVCYANARYYAFIGEREKTLACLEKAYEGRGFLSAFVKADPVFDDLRQEPRYREILRKMNLE